MTRRKFLKYFGISTLGLAGAGAWFSRPLAANPYYDGPVSDHFDGKIFFNPDGTPPGKFTDLLRWQLNGERATWPASYESPFHGAVPPSAVPASDIAVTHIGHATFLIQVDGLNFVTDPVWSDRASLLSFAGPKRINPPGVAFEDLPEIHGILLTHNHYDHMDMVTLERLVKTHDPLILTPLGCARHARPTNDVLVRLYAGNAVSENPSHRRYRFS